MKLIIINGSSCSGKSTIIKILMREKEDLFHLHFDGLKWFFSQYSKDKHSEYVQRVVMAVAHEVFDIGCNVVSDSSLTREFRENLISLAQQRGYEILEFNLEVDFDILLKRFKERVENAMKVPEKDRRISNISEERLKELFDIYNKEKNSNAITFKTDEETPEAIVEKIKKYL